MARPGKKSKAALKSVGAHFGGRAGAKVGKLLGDKKKGAKIGRFLGRQAAKALHKKAKQRYDKNVMRAAVM